MSDEFKTICINCKKEIGDQEMCFYNHTLKISMCMGCEGIEIEVFKITLPGEKNGYYEKEIKGFLDMLKECDIGEGYTVTKEKMSAWVYYNLPEFDGF